MTEEQQKNDKNDVTAGFTTESGAPIVDVVPNSQKIGKTVDIPKQFAKNDTIMSKGEKVFDWSVYKGLNYWVNLISSLAIADYLLNPASSGRKAMNSIIETATLAVEKTGMPLKNAHHNSKIWLETLALMSGGWLLLAPMKHLEDNKRNIVHSINDKLGVDQTAPDGHKETPDEIHIEKEQPKQSWGRVVWRRVLATLAVTSTGLALDHTFKDKNTILPPETYNIGGREIVYDGKFLGGKDRLTNIITENVNKGLKYLPEGEKLIAHAPTQRWIALAALDVFFTKITETVMFATSGAKPAKMPNEIDNSCDVPSHDKIPDQIVPDEISDTNKINYSAKFAPRNKEKPLATKKSLAPEEFLGMNKGESAQVGFA